ncbi:VanZ family protein [Paenibacillus sp. P36]|uniref:VanZ family protein n=1 Tax=Paenibacillus sp. P36 TaxID=3342538 RepID=UPI0038B32CE2
MGKINSKHIFIVYLIGLVNFVVVKFFGDIQRVIDRVVSNKAQKVMGYWNLELIPFRTISSSIDSYIRVGMVPSSINLIANIVVFVPMGYLITFVVRRPSFIKTLLISFASILGIEIIQFVTYLGSADIDDVLLNLIGSVMGYAVYMIYIVLQNKLNKGIETNHGTEK